MPTSNELMVGKVFGELQTMCYYNNKYKMEGLIVLGLILIVAAYFFGRIGFAVEENKEQSEYAKTNDAIDKAIDAEDSKTRNLVISTLKEIGCQPEIDDEDDICFKYQNEDFFIKADNDTAFIIIGSGFGSLSLNDPDINILKEAINQTNMDGRITLVYSINNGENIITVFCKHYLPFVQGMPSIQEYLRSNLDNFFWTHQYLENKFNALKENPTMQSSKERIIIKGFNTKRDNA